MGAKVVLDIPEPPKRSWFSWQGSPQSSQTTQQLAQKENQLDDLHHTLTLKEQQLHQKTQQLAQKEQSVGQLLNQKEKLASEIKRLETKREELKQETEELKQQRATLEQTLAEKNTELHTIQSILKETASRLALQQQDLEQREEEITAKEETFHNKEHELLKKEGIIGDEETRLNEKEKFFLHKELSLLDKQKILEQALDYLKKLQAELSREASEFSNTFNENFKQWTTAHKDLHELSSTVQREREAAQKLVANDLTLLQQREDELNQSIAEFLADSKRLEEDERSIVAKTRFLIARGKKLEHREALIVKREKEVKQREAFIHASLGKLERIKRNLEQRQHSLATAKDIAATIHQLEHYKESFEGELAAEAEELLLKKEENENKEVSTTEGIIKTLRTALNAKDLTTAKNVIPHLKKAQKESAGSDRERLTTLLKEFTTEIKLQELEQ